MEILPLLGTGLYNELCTQINANNVTALNQTLMNLLRPAVRMNVLAYGMIVFNYKIRNKGIQTMSSDNAQPVGLDVIDRMTQTFRDQAQVYSRRVRDYLMAHTGSYPLFTNPGATLDTIRPKSNQYFTGWVMGDDHSNCTLDNP